MGELLDRIKKEGIENYEKDRVIYNNLERKRGKLVDEDGFEFEDW